MHYRPVKLTLFMIAVSICGSVLLTLALGAASGRWFSSVLDFAQQSAYFATNFSAVFVGGVLGGQVQHARRNAATLLTFSGITAAFLALLYLVGFADFGIFSAPHRWNWLWFPALGSIGILGGIFGGKG